ncbi:uncharacterized protein LOC115236867 [Formica exsecta]|uniref:uncharacterized protein LOC115236867 n=1 Tax=Formica exsecta TaxID=72781 RepID=UPI001143D0BA|nr:uncharacterized protein LOC115236867 [Formica exsecta]
MTSPPASLEEFQERDSGWALSRILDLTVNINKYNPLRAGCHIKLPRAIIMKRAVIIVQSNDNACFAWSVVAALHPAKLKVDRESLYPHYTKVLNLQDIEVPVTANQIKKFELANDISINVYSIEEKNIVPIRLSELKRDRHVNLLYIEDNNVRHFAWIKNLSRLVSSQLSKHNGQKYICDRCLHYFDSYDKLQSHTVDCREMNECAIRLLSDKDKWLTSNNYNRKERLPFVVYADLECVLEKTEEERNYQHHKCDDVYENIRRNVDRFDTSDFEVDNVYGIPLANKKIPGLMKDEKNGAIIYTCYQFCGPGTHLETRLARGDRGINPLDAACREHDIAYSRCNDLGQRNRAMEGHGLYLTPYKRGRGGVFMCNKLPINGIRRNESGIVNLDDVDGSGTHWVAYAKRGDRVVYFDSFGNLRRPKELVRYFGQNVANIEYNHTTYQNYNQGICGQLCLRFLQTVDDRYEYKA